MTEKSITKKRRAASYISELTKGNYRFGLGCFPTLGALAASTGKRVSVVASGFHKEWGRPLHERILDSLAASHVRLAGPLIEGARPNTPVEDVFRIADALAEQSPDAVVAVGGGSVLDATKAALAYWTLRDRYPDLDSYFGVGEVSYMLIQSMRSLPPLIAVQLASASASHLTKYANVTRMDTAQKMLIADNAIVPGKALFDYESTVTMSLDFTMDGAFDGIAHCLEVFYGAQGEVLEQVWPVVLLGIGLLINNVRQACQTPDDLDAREALGLGTDLGGHAIMTGGTNGGHLTSFSLVDILPHGRACALMNPYYTVFFAPAIQDKLRAVGALFRASGYTDADLGKLAGRDLGIAVAEAMLALSQSVGFPTSLREVPGFSDAHIARALAAAKNPKLESKLKNMPVPLTADMIDGYMTPILEAAAQGDLSLVRNLP